MGGCIGFLKTMRRLVDDVQPSAVYVAWEGGGSTRRRKLFAEYKLARRPEKLNRFYEDDIPDTEDNRKYQLESLIHMSRCIPICSLYVSDCEGDDLVAYLCCGPMRDRNKVIVSSDKDLYQLLDDKTKQYSLHKKTFVTKNDVFEEFRVQSKHFAIAKALCGDKGDNVPGFRGIGFKTVSKLFPFLGLEGDILLQDVIDYASSHVDESNKFRDIVEHVEDLRRNWALVYLNGNMLSATQQATIDGRLSSYEPRSDHVGLVRLLIKDGINDFNVADFMYTFNCIEGLNSNGKGAS
jgi:5'-3' exonuclease